MFTQCEHCQAIFRVSMREVTVAKGLLRCGECKEVFDSSKSLSTSMQEPFKEASIDELKKSENLSPEALKTVLALDDWQTVQAADIETTNETLSNNRDTQKKRENNISLDGSDAQDEYKSRNASGYSVNAGALDSGITLDSGIKGVEHNSEQKDKSHKQSKNNQWFKIAAGLLTLLLIFQIAFNYRHLFLSSVRYAPEKIQMLNHNVFAHPIETGVLLISASIENTAEFDQPFPTLEVRLTNSKNEVVALRRFKAEEYLDNFQQGVLLPKNKATSLKLKIQDPGNQATRFQFNFL